MAKNDASNKIIKYKKPSGPNIGIIVFVIFIVYVMYNIYAYFTSDPIAEYEVQQGAIAINNIYQGLILRDETVVSANQSGYINYYVKNASKVSVNDMIYSIDVNGQIASDIREAGSNAGSLSKEGRSEIAAGISEFALSYDQDTFYEVYGFKDNMNSQLLQILNTNALLSMENEVVFAETNQMFYRNFSDKPGIVVYYTDGLEERTIDNFTSEDFNQTAYEKHNLDFNEQISAGDPVYKRINSENWNVIVPISEELAQKLSEDSSIKIRFCKDSVTTSTAYSIIKRDGNLYLNLQLIRYMIHYANDRYVEVELMLSEENGLKIPNSSIVSKQFFTIPKEYFTLGGDSDSRGILLQSTSDSGVITEWVDPTIYFENEEYCYIDSEDVSQGDVVLRSDSTDTYVVGTDTDSLQGVYSINKGYAVFKQIHIKYQNSEYAIIETNTDYGIALYDHIALDGSKVNEHQLVH